VLVEALVLDRDSRAAQVDRDVPPRDHAPQDVRLDEAEPRAVGGVYDRELPLVVGLQLREVRRGRCDGQHVADRCQRGDDRHRDEHADAEQHGAAPGMTATPPPQLSLPLCHSGLC
jgi:hypothetical protein